MPRVLIIAGSDSGGGAGLQADIKTVTMLGGYATTAVTAITVQDTKRVHSVYSVPPEYVADQISAVLTDIGADAVKIGMLSDAKTIGAVSYALDVARFTGPVVVDPVMVATSGDRLLDETAYKALKDMVLCRADVITPNLPEAEVLLEAKINDMEAAALALYSAFETPILLKGGHVSGDVVKDILFDGRDLETIVHRRRDTQSTHGTGCTLSSALATHLGAGRDLKTASCRAIDFVVAAIDAAPGYGRGHGPLGHACVSRAV